DFVLLWLGVGVGLSTVLGGRLHRGAFGAAGEVGWLPLPGAPVTDDVRYPPPRGGPWPGARGRAPGPAAADGFAPPGGGAAPARRIPGSGPGGSSTSWPAAWRSAPSRSARSSTPAW